MEDAWPIPKNLELRDMIDILEIPAILDIQKIPEILEVLEFPEISASAALDVA